jgi:hypothetical protein
VGHDVVVVETIVNAWLENLNFLASNFSAAQTPDKFLTLAREHASTNHLDPASPTLVVAGVWSAHVGNLCGGSTLKNTKVSLHPAVQSDCLRICGDY